MHEIICEYKICKSCNQNKLLTLEFFPMQTSTYINKDGVTRKYHSWNTCCRVCEAKRRKEYRKLEKEWEEKRKAGNTNPAFHSAQTETPN